MKEHGKEHLKQAIYESTRAPLHVDFYKGRCPKAGGWKSDVWRLISDVSQSPSLIPNPQLLVTIDTVHPARLSPALQSADRVRWLFDRPRT